MKAIRIHRFGGPEVLSLDDVLSTVPTGDQALVRLCAASVGPVDYKVRQGKYPGLEPSDLPIGRDLAGEGVAVGPDQHDRRSGDMVLAHLGRDRGGYAEQVVIESGEWARKPNALAIARFGERDVAQLVYLVGTSVSIAITRTGSQSRRRTRR